MEVVVGSVGYYVNRTFVMYTRLLVLYEGSLTVVMMGWTSSSVRKRTMHSERQQKRHSTLPVGSSRNKMGA